jgi:predicted DCC family thiol-disulfide oxidoreductase YuxK
VLDANGDRHLRFDAVVVCFRASLWAWPIAPILRLPPARYIGDLAYRTVARNRGRAGRATSFFSYRPLERYDTLPRRVGAILTAIGVLVLAWG